MATQQKVPMSVYSTPSSSRGGSLSCNVTTVFAVLTAITFSASGAAPTPLYQEYQNHFGLTPFMITVIFATYVLCLLLALLTVGSLSDFLGRRPAILSALAMNVAAMIIFMTAASAGALIVARAVQGFATGLAATTLGATILDTDRDRAPMLNSVTAFAGLSAGTLLAGVLVTFAPAPEQLVFIVLLGLSVMEAAVLWFMPETSTLKSGALASLLPHVRIPSEARSTFVSITPVNIAAWALGGFYFSLMPAVVRVGTGATLPIVGGVVVAALTLTGAVIVVVLRNVAPDRMLRIGIASLSFGVIITLAGAQYQLVSVMLIGTVVSGMGFGSVFSGSLRTVMPFARPDERASLLSAYFIEGYLAFSLPAVLAGFLAPIVGLTTAANFYGICVILFAVASLAATMSRRNAATCTTVSSPQRCSREAAP
jgi:MFS family permease